MVFVHLIVDPITCVPFAYRLLSLGVNVSMRLSSASALVLSVVVNRFRHTFATVSKIDTT